MVRMGPLTHQLVEWPKQAQEEVSTCRFVIRQHDGLNPFTPRSDQYINSPFNYNTLSSRQVMRIKKIINLEIVF